MILNANSVHIPMADGSVHMAVTSPPYFGLRNYGIDGTDWKAVTYTPMAGLPSVTVEPWRGCLGLEPTPEMFVAHIVSVFREVWRVLRDDGTCWVNFGDSYASTTKGDNRTAEELANGPHTLTGGQDFRVAHATGTRKVDKIGRAHV